MIKVSIIIPVYNVEPYLKEALDSVTNQTLKEIEIICIDDCSTDNSYNILEEYAKKDDRIILLKNKENMGVGYTRNVGEKLSKGEYIYFIDPDDYIALDFLELMYNTAKKYNSEIVVTNNLYKLRDNDIYPFFNNEISFEEYEINIDLKNFYSKDIKSKLSYNLWSKIFKKDFLINNNLFSTENKNGSAYDADLLCRIIINKPNVSFNNKAKYYYRIRSNSITENIMNNTEKISYVIENSKKTINYCKKLNPQYLNDLYIILWHFIMFIFLNSKHINLNIYREIYLYANELEITKPYQYYNEYNEYLLIKTNDTYEKYLLQKELFENISNIKNRINQLDNKIIKKQNNKIKLFGIEKFNDKIIIYFFGIKITLKK